MPSRRSRHGRARASTTPTSPPCSTPRATATTRSSIPEGADSCAYSLTTITPFMSSCPSPQKLSQRKVKRPAFSGTTRTRTVVSGRTTTPTSPPLLHFLRILPLRHQPFFGGALNRELEHIADLEVLTSDIHESSRIFIPTSKFSRKCWRIEGD